MSRHNSTTSEAGTSYANLGPKTEMQVKKIIIIKINKKIKKKMNLLSACRLQTFQLHFLMK
jgi:hypothetical protein